MVNAPNMWMPLKETYWSVTSGDAVDIWGCLKIVDYYGERAYVPALGSTMTVTFMRGDYISSLTNQHLTVNKTAIMDTNCRSFFKLSLTSTEATNIITGTVNFILIEGLAAQKWQQHYFVKKTNVGPGF